MKRTITIFSILTLAAIICGCGSTIGMYPSIAETQTQLNQSNYKVIQTGVTGSASAWYFLNVIPLGDSELYKRAMNDIRMKVSTGSRSYSFVNVTQDVSLVTYFIVSKSTVTITADVVEFTN